MWFRDVTDLLSHLEKMTPTDKREGGGGFRTAVALALLLVVIAVASHSTHKMAARPRR